MKRLWIFLFPVLLSAQFIPQYRIVASLPAAGNTGEIVILATDSTFYQDGATWVSTGKRAQANWFTNVLRIPDTTSLSNRISAVQTVDTTSLSNRINLKMSASDTTSLSNRINTKLTATDTTSLSNRVNTKLNAADTTNMLGVTIYRSTGADSVNSRGTPVTLTDLTWTMEASKTYDFEARLLFLSRTATVGLAVLVDCASAPTSISYTAEIPLAADAAAGMWHGWGTADADTIIATAAPAATGGANTTGMYQALIYGRIVNSAGSNAVVFKIKSEITGTYLSVWSPSSLWYRKLN
jgi:hypothetical protein